MTSKLKIAIPLLVLFALLFLLWVELSSNRTQNNISSNMVGEHIPTFSVPSITGAGTVSNKSLQGRVVLLNFWASWCSACAAEHPMLLKIKNEYNVPIYGIAFRDNKEDAANVLKSEGNPYVAVGYDASGATGVDFGIYGTPETYVVSPSGNIIFKQVGMLDEYTWKNTIYPLIQQYHD